MNKIDKSCIECKNKGRKSVYFNFYLCLECRTRDKYTLMTKTNAKKKYLLKDKELDDIDKIIGNSSYGPATYFTITNIKQYLCEKYNLFPDQLDDFMTELIYQKNIKAEIRKKKSDENKKIKINKRKNKLINELNKYKLQLRNDSVLCQKYIDGVSDYDLDEFVLKMCEMKYLYEYCHMGECRNIAYEHYISEKEAGYYPDMSVSEHAEMIALEKYSNGKYPDTFPWLV